MNTSKKTFCFNKSELIDSLLKDYAATRTYGNESELVEDILLEYLLPESKYIRRDVEQSLYGEEGSLIDFCQSVLSHDGNWFGYTENYDDMYTFIKFIRQLEYDKKNMIVESSNKRGFVGLVLKRLDSIRQVLEEAAKKESNELRSEKIQRQSKIAEKYINQIANIARIEKYQTTDKEKTSEFPIYVLFDFVLENWQEINRWPYTQGMLITLLEITEEIEDTPQTRTQAMKITNNVIC